MKVLTTTQRTPEWFAARLGMFTASCAADMLAQIKSGESAKRRDLRMRLVCERLTGQPQEDTYVNAAMQRGIDKEGDAFAAYEALTGEMANTVGFLAHDTLLAGCSPDGEMGGYQGLLEVKCPKTSTHVGYIRAKGIPSDYRPQMVHALWITGAEWCDFVSFDDRLPEHLQLFVARLHRDPKEIAAYEMAATLFLNEVQKECDEVTGLVPA